MASQTLTAAQLGAAGPRTSAFWHFILSQEILRFCPILGTPGSSWSLTKGLSAVQPTQILVATIKSFIHSGSIV